MSNPRTLLPGPLFVINGGAALEERCSIFNTQLVNACSRLEDAIHSVRARANSHDVRANGK